MILDYRLASLIGTKACVLRPAHLLAAEVLRNRVPPAGVLVAQTWLLQAWIPPFTEKALLVAESAESACSDSSSWYQQVHCLHQFV